MIRIKRVIHRISSFHLFLPIVCLLLVLLANVIKTPNFFNITVKNGVLYGFIIDVINRGSELVIYAVGMTLVVAASGGTDISVGAVSALSGAVCCYILAGGEQSVSTYHAPYLFGVLAAVATGLLCGAWNGFLVAKMRIQPMVATLILFTAGRGIAQLITDGQMIYIRVEHFKQLGATIPGVPLPTPVFVAVLVVIITNVILRRTALGMYIQAVGVNCKASRLLGLNSTKIKFLSYTFCGVCSGIAGLIITSRVYSIDANNAGLNLELDAILAVALGGNSLSGGKFSLIGSVIGAYTIQALTTTLYAMSVSADQIPVYKAIVVVIIVSLQSREFTRMRKAIRLRLIRRKDALEVAE